MLPATPTPPATTNAPVVVLVLVAVPVTLAQDVNVPVDPVCTAPVLPIVAAFTVLDITVPLLVKFP